MEMWYSHETTFMLQNQKLQQESPLHLFSLTVLKTFQLQTIDSCTIREYFCSFLLATLKIVFHMVFTQPIPLKTMNSLGRTLHQEIQNLFYSFTFSLFSFEQLILRIEIMWLKTFIAQMPRWLLYKLLLRLDLLILKYETTPILTYPLLELLQHN